MKREGYAQSNKRSIRVWLWAGYNALATNGIRSKLVSVFCTRKRCLGVVNLTDLPTELMLLIFSQLTVEELCFTIAPVCKAWYQLSRHPSLWKELSFTTSLCTKDVCTLLQRSSQLKQCQLIERTDVDKVLNQLSCTNKQLETLVIKQCKNSLHTDVVSAGLLRNLIQQCPGISNLTIQNTPFDGMKLCQIIDDLLPNIQRIDFRYDIQIFRIARVEAIEFFQPMKELKCFRRQQFQVQGILSPYYDDHIKTLCTNLGSTLKVLKLTVGVLTDNIMEGIAICHHLQTLYLQYALYITRNGLMKLTHLKKLTSLYISVTRFISVVTWCDFFNTAKWTQLKKLQLVCCPIINEDVLSTISDRFPELRKLRLSGCREANGKGLSHVIRSCSKLKYLNVFLTGRSVAHSLLLIPMYIPKLEILVYKPTGFQKEHFILNALKHAAPNLKIKEIDV